MAGSSFEDIVIQIKNSYKTKTYGDIYSGVYIKEFLYIFEDIEIFDGKAAVRIPVVFRDMPDDIVRLKFPNINRPQIIKTNGKGDVNLCFGIMKQKITLEEINKYAQEIKNVMVKLHTGSDYTDVHGSNNSTNQFSWFTYKGHSIDETVFFHMFVTTIGENLAIGTFSCPFVEKELWECVMIDIMLTFRNNNT